MARPCDGTSTDCNIIGVPGVEAKFGLGTAAKLPKRCSYKMQKQDVLMYEPQKPGKELYGLFAVEIGIRDDQGRLKDSRTNPRSNDARTMLHEGPLFHSQKSQQARLSTKWELGLPTVSELT